MTDDYPIEEPLVIGYLTFTEIPNPGRKTAIVKVTSTSKKIELGTIKWYGKWRQYVFYPEPETLFNAKCLMDITTIVRGLGSRQLQRRRAE